MLAAISSFLGLTPNPAYASGRVFTYNYESRVLPKGEVEFEPWVTWRHSRSGFYNRIDTRLEFEVGVTDRLQTAFYINTKAATEETVTGRATEYEFEGISSEWKYKFSDPVADALGFALYLEGTLSSSEGELEQKFIFDKEIGKFLAALNIVSEYEWDFGGVPTDRAFELEIDAGLSYPVTSAFSLGVELRNHNEFPTTDSWAHSALFLGPVASYAQEGWWGALTVLPQVVGLKGATQDHLVLGDLERLEVRLLLGFEI